MQPVMSPGLPGWNSLCVSRPAHVCYPLLCPSTNDQHFVVFCCMRDPTLVTIYNADVAPECNESPGAETNQQKTRVVGTDAKWVLSMSPL